MVLTVGCSPRTGVTHWMLPFGETACGYWSTGWSTWTQSSHDHFDCPRCERKRLREVSR